MLQATSFWQYSPTCIITPDRLECIHFINDWHVLIPPEKNIQDYVLSWSLYIISCGLLWTIMISYIYIYYIIINTYSIGNKSLRNRSWKISVLRVGWWRYHDSTRYGYRKQRNDKDHALRLLAPATKNKWPKGYKQLRDLSIIRSALFKTPKPHAPPCSSQLSYVLETKHVQNIIFGSAKQNPFRPSNFFLNFWMEPSCTMINLPSSTCCAELQRIVDDSLSDLSETYININIYIHSIPDHV